MMLALALVASRALAASHGATAIRESGEDGLFTAARDPLEDMTWASGAGADPAAVAASSADGPYTMLVCEPAECALYDFCTSRTDRLNPSWHAPPCPSETEACDGRRIACASLKYVTIDDVAATYGARAPATDADLTSTTALFVSVQREVASAGSELGREAQRNVEWLHVMAQGVSNEEHWLGPPDGWYGLKSMEAKTGAQTPNRGHGTGGVHLVMDDADLLAASFIENDAGLHVDSFTRAYETSKMPDGSDDIGNLIVQLVDEDLWSAVAGNQFPQCEILERLALGVADNYDYVFFSAAGAGYYTSTHMNVHQTEIPGTGTGATNIGGCGGARVKGVTALQPLNAGSMGPFYHEWFHQFAANLGAVSPELGSGTGGHWGWVAFPDHRGILGGFNYFLCPDGTRGFSMDAANDPERECGFEAGDVISVNVDEVEATLEAPAGFPAGTRWGTLGDPAGRPDYLWSDNPFNGLERYVLGLPGYALEDLGGGGGAVVDTPKPTPKPAGPGGDYSTLSPTAGCEDSSSWYAKKESKTCDWVAKKNDKKDWDKKKAKKLCKKKSEDKIKASEACACDACDADKFKKDADADEASVAIIVPCVVGGILLIGAAAYLLQKKRAAAKQPHSRASMPDASA